MVDLLTVPWPAVPCCPCSSEIDHHRDARGRPYKALAREAARLAGDIYAVPYDEADGYYWHDAGWDRRTGRWFARCCLGHRLQGVQR